MATRRFVPKFARVARPLIAILKNDYDVNWEAPLKRKLEAFNEIKKHTANPLIMGLTKRGGSYMGDTNARQYALGAKILQEQEVDGVN